MHKGRHRRASKDIRTSYTISYCKCPSCENLFPIPRRNSRQREKGHLKYIWCPFCKTKTNHLEFRECDFMEV